MNIYNGFQIRVTVTYFVRKNIDTFFCGSETENIVHNFAQSFTNCLLND